MLHPLRLAAPLALSAALSAPVQCASKVRPEFRHEDDAAEVVYTLAQRFKAQGNEVARTETLRFLVTQYPSSRFAVAARLDLGESDAGPQ